MFENAFTFNFWLFVSFLLIVIGILIELDMGTNAKQDNRYNVTVKTDKFIIAKGLQLAGAIIATLSAVYFMNTA